MSHPRRLSALVAGGLVAASTALALAPAAHAEQQLPGTPLNVYVGDKGQLQARIAGQADGIFYSPDSNTGDAGLFLAFPATQAPRQAQLPALSGKVFGFDGTSGNSQGFDQYATRGQDATTGSGTAADPRKQVTNFAIPDPDAAGDPAKDLVAVRQTTTYVDGGYTFDVTWEITNKTAQPLPFKALNAADFYFEGDDAGTGIFTQGPPRFIGGTNVDTGRSGGFIEAPRPATPWSHYQALAYRDDFGPGVWQRVKDAASTTDGSFDDSVLGESTDNAGATEWDQALDTPLGSGQTTTYAVTVRTALPAALAFDKTNAGSPAGVPIAYVVTAKDTSGQPYAGKVLRYSVGGVNPGAGAVPINPDGTAAIVDPGTNPGTDTIIAFLDLNNNGVREPAEPQGSALGTFVDTVPAKCTVGVTGSKLSPGTNGKPLVITGNCDSVATVVTTTTLRITRPARRVNGRRIKRKVLTARLPVVTQPVSPGQAVPLDVALPRTLQRKYPGLKARASVTVTATDAANNVSTFTAARSTTIAKPAKRKR
jgi:hypothetical protein